MGRSPCLTPKPRVGMHHVQLSRQQNPQPHIFTSLLPETQSPSSLSNHYIVSSDAVIAVVFGLVGAILSLVGTIIACLTLRFMILEKGMLLFSSSQTLILTKFLTDERRLRIHGDHYGSILRHEHTHLFPQSQGQEARQRTLKIV